MRSLLRALEHRNYRLFFAGQSVSLVGTWITRVTTSWLVWRLTQSPEMLGLLGFLGHLPTLLLAPVAGVWVDRLDRHGLLVVTQACAMLQSFALAALTLFGVVEVWHIFVLQALQGVINAFDMPTRQALLVDLVDERADLPNAIALNSSMVNGSRLVGPSIAGVLIAMLGEGWCFFLDGLSYGAVIASLLVMRGIVRRPARKSCRLLGELLDGLNYVRGFMPIRALLLLLALLGLVGMPYAVLLPIIATQTLGGGPHTLGFLMGAMGAGATLSALYLASRRSVVGLGRLIPMAASVFGLGLMGVGISAVPAVSISLMVLVGMGFMLQLASSNTLIQTLVRDDMRGRVMALYAVAFMGMTPFGSLAAGAIAARVGAPLTLVGAGVICLVGAIAFARKLPELRKQVRPIYQEKGILPALAGGLGHAAAVEEEVAP
jgi:MFS family permease